MEIIIVVAVVLFLLWFFGLLGGIRREAALWGDRALKQSQDLRMKAAEARLQTIREDRKISGEDIEALVAYNTYLEKMKELDL